MKPEISSIRKKAMSMASMMLILVDFDQAMAMVGSLVRGSRSDRWRVIQWFKSGLGVGYIKYSVKSCCREVVSAR